MANKDLTSFISAKLALFGDPVVTGANPGEIIDTSGFYSLTFVQITGAIGASFQMTVAIVDGNDANLADAAPVDASFLIGNLADLNIDAFANPPSQFEDRAWQIGYVGKKRYVRFDLTGIGAIPANTFYSVAAIRESSADAATIVNV